ncbi:unnamed protein product [Camellia sinensis]
MARPSLRFLSLTLFILYSADITKSTVPTNFIEASCSATRHPELCVKSLSIHANAIQKNPYILTQTALTVSLALAESTKANMLKLTSIKGLKAPEYGALKDCLDQIDDSVDRLSQSIREIEKLSEAQGEDFMWHKSNVQTWSSSALTDIKTCEEGFSGQTLDGKIKASVQGQVTNVEQLISNALALIKQCEAKH